MRASHTILAGGGRAERPDRLRGWTRGAAGIRWQVCPPSSRLSREVWAAADGSGTEARAGDGRAEDQGDQVCGELHLAHHTTEKRARKDLDANIMKQVDETAFALRMDLAREKKLREEVAQ